MKMKENDWEIKPRSRRERKRRIERLRRRLRKTRFI